jgi:hypothetical protein
VIGRFVLLLMVGALLVSYLIAFGLPRPVSAQAPLPTPEGRLGGRMPLPTATGLPGGSLPQDTPTPSRHPLLGAWLLTFTEPDQAPAQVVLGNDGIVMFIDATGNRGAGVWMPSGQQRGILTVVVREVDASGRSLQITRLQGPFDVATAGDAATLVYTIETVDEAGTTSKPAGPFTAMGQRVEEQLIVPTSE